MTYKYLTIAFVVIGTEAVELQRMMGADPATWSHSGPAILGANPATWGGHTLAQTEANDDDDLWVLY